MKRSTFFDDACLAFILVVMACWLGSVIGGRP